MNAGRRIAAGAILIALTSSAWSGRTIRGQQPDSAALARRQAALDELVKLSGPTAVKFSGRLNATDKTWEAWQKRTGELPPDFDAMPSVGEIPDPLVPLGQPGAPRITTAAQWSRQREAIRAGFERWVFGRMPPAPGNVRVRSTERHTEGQIAVDDVVLEFGPEHRGVLRLQLLVPPGKGPFPVFMTNHPRRRPWVNPAIRRGYIGCIVYAVDPYYRALGSDDDSDAWIELYPEYDFSMIARWAWGAMRAVDYLATRPDVNAKQIAITGHSRNSKSALLAAAFDERIGAVVPSRGNNGDQIPWRFSSDVYVSESLEELTTGMPNWFHPRLRFFAGREQKLPVDQNLLVSMVAPRGFMFSHAFTEHQGNAVGIEAAYRSVKSVYRLLGHEQNVGLYQQPGEHESSPEDVDVYLDFFDTVFGRGKIPVPEIWVRNYTFERWREQSGERIDPLSFPVRKIGDFLKRGDTPAAIQKQIRWALGDEPASAPLPAGTNLLENLYTMVSTGHLGALLSRPAQGMTAIPFGFGDNIAGELYTPASLDLRAMFMSAAAAMAKARAADPSKPAPLQVGGDAAALMAYLPPLPKLPLVIWLHPYSYATGYSRYAMWAPLTKRGFLVMAFDQIGFGSRSDEALKFYARYPHWSLFGKMVADVRAAIDRLSDVGLVDPTRIYLMGYGLGGKLAITTAALDDRVAGTVSISGFAPLRLDTPEKGTEGVRHYSHIHGLIPRFGFFQGHENRLPIDFDEILAAIAPRPVWINAPTLDRFNPVDDVRLAVEAARKAYHADGPVLETPVDFHALPEESREQAAEWLRALAGLPAPAPSGKQQ